MTMPIIYPVLVSRANSVSKPPAPHHCLFPPRGLNCQDTQSGSGRKCLWSSSLPRKPFSLQLTPPSCFWSQAEFPSST